MPPLLKGYRVLKEKGGDTGGTPKRCTTPTPRKDVRRLLQARKGIEQLQDWRRKQSNGLLERGRNNDTAEKYVQHEGGHPLRRKGQEEKAIREIPFASCYKQTPSNNL